MTEPFVETLFRPIVRGQIAVPDAPIVYANALPTPQLEVLPPQQLRLWQSRRSDAIDVGMFDATSGGGSVTDGDELAVVADGAQLALLPLRKQREESFAMAAVLWDGLADGGVLVAAAPNTGGARGYERAFDEALGGVSSISKNKARAFWATKGSFAAPREWLEGWRPRTIEGGWTTVPGLFSSEQVDPASALLVEVLSDRELAGEIHDLGAGWGYLSGALVRAGLAPERFHLWENDRRALRFARENVGPEVTLHWADVTRECGEEIADTIVMNPPFHAGHRTDVGLGLAFVETAARALRPGGVLWMVANVHLPYERTIEMLFSSYQIEVERSGFKVIRALF